MEQTWDNIETFQRHPKLRDEMQREGDERIVTFLSDGKVVDEDVIKAALARKNLDRIKSSKSVVFVVEKEEDEEKREIWHRITDFTVLGQLKKIKEANNGTLVGAKVKVKRIAVGKPGQPNWNYELAEES